MVISLLNACGTSSLLNQPKLDSTIHWRQSPQSTSAETDQENCILTFNNREQGPSSPVQNDEESSCFSSENGADNMSPSQEPSRSPGSEDLGQNLFPISGCSVSAQCLDYSDNESSQASPSSFHDDDSFRTTKSGNSSNGKPKIHKCRNCDFSTTDKFAIWAHLSLHMKPEKILRCSECPFVTEYKHHLDFHMLNHQGKKQFKCDRCKYECVNKSMLKSHMKSHSNVYQYSCRDCTYRTKYCHSLKIHLRKYTHKPGTVLDSEGNPNPNPVIDVYGNRRGPKQKPKKHSGNNPPPLQPNVSPIHAFNFSWMGNVFFPENPHIPCPALPNAFMGNSFANDDTKPDIASQETDNLNNNVKIALNNNNLPKHDSLSTPNIADVVKREKMDEDGVQETEMYRPSICIEEKPSTSPLPPPHNLFSPYERIPVDRIPSMPELMAGPIAAAVTRTVATPIPPMPLIVPEPLTNDIPLNLSVSHSSNSSTENNGTPIVKNRRKGVACKLTRPYPDLNRTTKKSSVCNNPIETRVTESSHSEGQADFPAAPSVEVSPHSDQESSARLKTKKNLHTCEYCEITFCNQIMFNMHMGYHGYSDPFTCNRCGQKTDNRIDFYDHLLSASHL